MDWIKRNLFFVIGSFVGVLMLGGAGFYLYTKWQLNNDILRQLDEQYAELERLNGQKPHPGEKGKVDNIQLARDQQQQLRDYSRKTRDYFQHIAPIPGGKLSDPNFSSALSRTLDQLHKDASSASVNLPPKTPTGGTYSFSFEAQRQAVSFASGSLPPLAQQLGEVKAICDILIQARINSLDNLKREAVSEDDTRSTQAQTDYLGRHSVTNELAVLTPYEVTFRCFSSELASVLAGFASSRNGMLVRSINVELAQATPEETTTQTPVVVQPAYVPPVVQPQPRPRQEFDAEFSRRYGIGPGGRGVNRFGPPQQPTPAPAAVAPPAATAPPATGGKGLATVLDEKTLKVVITIEVVKLLPGAFGK